MDNYYISAKQRKEAKEYWRDQLTGDLAAISLPLCQTQKTKPAAAKELAYTLEREVEEKILSISKNSSILLYVYLLSAFKVLLWKLSGSQDICVSSPAYMESQQPGEQGNHQLLIIRDHVAEQMTFQQLLTAVKQTAFNAYKYQYYPLNRIIEAFSHHVCMGLLNIHGMESMDEMIRKHEYHFIFLWEKQEHLKGKIIYHSKIMDEASAQRLLTAYQHILKQVTEDMSQPISKLELVNEEGRKQLQQWNDTRTDFSGAKTIPELFEEQADKAGENIAVSYIKGQSKSCVRLTYKELKDRANQLAFVLQKKGVGRGDIVGIMAYPSLDLAVGILGILKAGGAYLPIEPGYPAERIQYIAGDSKMKLLVTNCDIPNDEFPVALLRLSGDELDQEGVAAPFGVGAALDDPAYMIYTSGSTGKPKGIAATHKNLFNYAMWRIKTLGHSTQDVSLQLLTAAFDGFGANFYPALLSGGSVVFVDHTYWRDADYINQVIADQGVTNFSVVPLLYNRILEEARPGMWQDLRFVVLAGEKSEADLIKLSQKKYPKLLLVNEYGPTETTITAAALCGMNVNNRSIIGTPIANHKIHILDECNQLMPIGFFGELCISGAGVTRGYQNQAVLTAEKFIKNPFSEQESLYKTGDLARWREDGTIELLGRMDRQLKLMGYRIEPEELESVIAGVKGIQKCIVRTGTGSAGYTELWAFYTADSKLPTKQLRKKLAGELPDYMMPSQLIQLDEFPLLPNGKINVNALRLRKQEMAMNTNIAPQNEIETALINIWKQVLKQERIGTNDNFFDLGGNSILVMQVHSQIEKLYPGVARIPDLFAYPSIAKLAEFIKRSADKEVKN